MCVPYLSRFLLHSLTQPPGHSPTDGTLFHHDPRCEKFARLKPPAIVTGLSEASCKTYCQSSRSGAVAMVGWIRFHTLIHLTTETCGIRRSHDYIECELELRCSVILGDAWQRCALIYLRFISSNSSFPTSRTSSPSASNLVSPESRHVEALCSQLVFRATSSALPIPLPRSSDSASIHS